MITGDMVKPGAWVIDVGINRLDTGQLVGDVDFDIRERPGPRHHPGPGRRRPHDDRDADAEHLDRRRHEYAQDSSAPARPALDGGQEWMAERAVLTCRS